MVKQNLAFCLLYSVFGGTGGTLAMAVTAYEDDREKERGIKSSPRRRILGLLGNLLFQGFSTLFLTIAPWYGPVSLYRPTVLSAKLLSNMLVFGVIMKKRDLKKDNIVATANCVLAVILLPIVGPGTQEEQDVAELFKKPYALTWIIATLFLFIIATVYTINVDLKKKSQFKVQTCLLTIGVIASAMSGTISKAMISLSGPYQVASMVYYIVLQVVWIIEKIVEATAVTNLIVFIPLYTLSSLSVNAIIGLLIWEDWRVIESWVGYACVFLLMFLGLYLMSDLDFFKQEQEQLQQITRRRNAELKGSLRESKSLAFDCKTLQEESSEEENEEIQQEVVTDPSASEDGILCFLNNSKHPPNEDLERGSGLTATDEDQAVAYASPGSNKAPSITAEDFKGEVHLSAHDFDREKHVASCAYPVDASSTFDLQDQLGSENNEECHESPEKEFPGTSEGRIISTSSDDPGSALCTEDHQFLKIFDELDAEKKGTLNREETLLLLQKWESSRGKSTGHLMDT